MDDRLLTFYEERAKSWLLRRVPVIVRLDGKAFHTFCRQFEKPYDSILNECLSNTMAFLCRKVQGVVYAQRHSDEISLLLLDFQKETSDAFYDYNAQKMASVIASMCSTEFCRQLLLQGKLSLEKEFPTFDGRAFNIPEFEVVNYFWDRSLDCVRNSVQNLARTKFSHKQLHGKNNNEMQEMLFQEHGINWNDLPQEQKAGVSCFKVIEKRIEKIPLGRVSTFFSANYKVKAEVERSVWKLDPVPSLKNSLKDVIKACCKTSMDRTDLVSKEEEE